jgi:hypothetical protein
MRMAITRKQNTKCGRGCEEVETSAHCWWQHKMVQPVWRMVCQSLKKGKRMSKRIEIRNSNGTLVFTATSLTAKGILTRAAI